MKRMRTRCVHCHGLVGDFLLAVEVAPGAWVCEHCTDEFCCPPLSAMSTAKEIPPEVSAKANARDDKP